MIGTRLTAIGLTVFLILGLAVQVKAETGPPLKDIVELNIRAAGGMEKISGIENLVFTIGQLRYHAASDGRVKIMAGRDPVVTEVILIGPDGVKRNCYNKVTEITGIEEAMHLGLAHLYSGAFTLLKFKDRLEDLGTKSFGLEKLRHLTTRIAELQMDFYLRPDDWTIKRIVFHGFSPEKDKFEVNYDFGPYEETEGLHIPTSWFSSRVGTRGSVSELSRLKINQPLDKDFFSSLEINVGKVDISPGHLRGNLVDFSQRGPGQIILSTNWTKECLEKAGFKNDEKGILTMAGKDIELTFYEASPPRTAFALGARIMGPHPQDGNYLVYLLSNEFIPIFEQLRPLLAVELKKKQIP